jgi:hypothetical protein
MNILLLTFLCISIVLITIGYLEDTTKIITDSEISLPEKNIPMSLYDTQFNDTMDKHSHLFTVPNIWLNYPFNANESIQRDLKYHNEINKERN